MSNTTLAEQLATGASQLGLPLSDEQVEQLMQYQQLMLRWNKVYNLTAITDPQRVLTHHLLDSLAVAPYIQGSRLLDVGSGAGLPGVPLAVLQPDLEVFLLDSNKKKTRFMQQAAIELGLENITVIASRIEDYAAPSRFDTVIGRAFAALADFVKSCGQHCKANGRLLAMRAKIEASDETWQDCGFTVASCHQLRVPGLDAQRSIISLRPSNGDENV